MYFQEALARTECRRFPASVDNPYNIRMRDLSPTLPSTLNYLYRVNTEERGLGWERNNRDIVKMRTALLALGSYDVICLPISVTAFLARLIAAGINEEVIKPSRERRRVKAERGLQLA